MSAASSKPYVPEVELTAGQPAPIAANRGKAYTSLDVDGDAGTTAAVADALTQIAGGDGQTVTDLSKMPSPAPSKTDWGLGFRRYAECMDHIREKNPQVPEGGVALPLRYTIFRRHPIPWCHPTQFGRIRLARTKRPSLPRTSTTMLAAVCISPKF